MKMTSVKISNKLGHAIHFSGQGESLKFKEGGQIISFKRHAGQ